MPKRVVVKILTLLLGFLGMISGYAGQSAVKCNVVPDKKSAVYKCGEIVNFTISLKNGSDLLKDGIATVIFSNDGLRQLKKQSHGLAMGNPFKVSIACQQPGFVQCRVIFKNKSYFGGAAFEPEKIKPVSDMPKDFDKFWGNAIQELEKIPVDVKLSKDNRFKSSHFDMFRLSLANINNNRIYGFLSVPKNRKGPFPAIILTPGAGASLSDPFFGPAYKKAFYKKLASSGTLVLVLNVHDYEPPVNITEYKRTLRQMQKKLGAYMFNGAPDKNKYFYKQAILGLYRAVNYVASRSDWDGKHFVAAGFSQGGGMTLALGALNKNITAVAAQNPALCDHEGFKVGRSPGWPRLYRRGGANKEKFMKMASYFDGVNFARKLKCPVLFAVGFTDNTCSPSSVYSAYNSVKSSKLIINMPQVAHAYPKLYYKTVMDWITLQL
jgi:cephalosporin-C deacetylase